MCLRLEKRVKDCDQTHFHSFFVLLFCKEILCLGKSTLNIHWITNHNLDASIDPYSLPTNVRETCGEGWMKKPWLLSSREERVMKSRGKREIQGTIWEIYGKVFLEERFVGFWGLRRVSRKRRKRSGKRRFVGSVFKR